MAETNGSGAPPVANRIVVAGELRRALASRHRNQRSSVLLLRAAPEWRGEHEFEADIEGTRLPVAIATCRTVLAVLDAMAQQREAGRYLVVLTPREPHEVGESVLARAMLPEIKPINRWDLVRDAFGARRLDETLGRSGSHWIAEALLEAQPADGWRRLVGPVLTRAIALNRLAAIRLGIDAVDDTAVDGAALLQWTADRAAVTSFLRLRDVERDGLINWLTETTGGVATVVFAMTATGKIPDAIPVGLAFGALEGQPAESQDERILVARVRAEERFFDGARLTEEQLRPFREAAESLVTRWAANGHAALAGTLCDRAEDILTELGVAETAKHSRVLEAGLDACFAMLAAALADFLAGVPDAVARAELALRRIQDHARRQDREVEATVAEATVRIVRWLAIDEAESAAPSDFAIRLIRSWAWADRALGLLARTGTSRVSGLAELYAALRERATARRDRLDAAFTSAVVRSAEQAGARTSLLAENILDQVVHPVVAKRPPVILFIDGMGAADGCELAEAFAATGLWQEAGRRPDGREAGLVLSPQATVIPQMELEDQASREDREEAGFTACWGRRASALYRDADLVPELADRVRDAILDPDTVVGIVVTDVAYLRPVLDEARRAGCPVVLIGCPDGSSPGPLVAPVFTLVPDRALLPPGWSIYDAVGHAPAWWESSSARQQDVQPFQAPSRSVPARRKRPVSAAPADAADALFGVQEVTPLNAATATASTLGAQVTASQRLASQREYVRRAPDDASVAALVDGLVRAGGQLTLAEAAALTGEPAVRMSGYLAQLGRLLNVDGYAVLQVADGGKTVKLDQRLLRQQFLGE